MHYALKLPQHSGTFVREKGSWGLYHKYCIANNLAKKGIGGTVIPILTPIKTRNKASRNSPCECGSGLKYKKCCLNKSTPQPLVASKQQAHYPQLHPEGPDLGGA